MLHSAGARGSDQQAADPLTWEEAVQIMSQQKGVVVVVGGADTGKSTLVLAAANAAVQQGRRVAVLDTDLGQGEIGPPGVLGLVHLEQPTVTLGELRSRAMAFVGETSPIGHLLAVVQGARRLATHSRTRGDEVLFVDTSGLVSGRVAEKLKLAKLAVLEPALIVCLERGNELRRLTALIRGSTTARVVSVRSPLEVRTKSPVYRRIQRGNRLRKHFQGARLHEIPAGQVSVLDAWVFTGIALPARQLKLAAEALGADVPHGEQTPDGVYLCVAGRPDRRGYVTLQEEFGKKRIVVSSAVAFQNLLVGLIGPEGHLLDVGLLQGINFERALFSILSPIRSVQEVGQIQFGRFRARESGAEIAHLRPSDL